MTSPVPLKTSFDTSAYIKDVVWRPLEPFLGIPKGSCIARDHPHQLLIHTQSFWSISKPEIWQKPLCTEKRFKRLLPAVFQGVNHWVWDELGVSKFYKLVQMHNHLICIEVSLPLKICHGVPKKRATETLLLKLNPILATDLINCYMLSGL